MEFFNKESKLEKYILILYFANALFEIIAEFFINKSILFFLKPLTLLILMLLYWKSSKQRSSLFFIAIFFLIIARLFLIFTTQDMLFLGTTSYFIYGLVIIYYIHKLIRLKDVVPLLLAMIPFLFVFFYLLTLASNITVGLYYGLIIQSVLMSIFGGMTLSHYIMNDDKNAFWLLLFGLLSSMQYFIVFLEKFYLLDLPPLSMRPLSVLLTTMVNFTFYIFVIETEMSQQD